MTTHAICEVHTSVCCIHPYFGYVCTPGARLDFSDIVPAAFGHGAIAEIDDHGFRNTGFPAEKPPHEFWIGLFGGSVAFSAAASDNAHTLSACLERVLNASGGWAGRNVRVYNFALPAAQQPQHLAIFLQHRARLDGIITFDGVNEVVVPSWYNGDHIPPTFPYLPYYQALYGRTVSEEQITLAEAAKRDDDWVEQLPAWRRFLVRKRHVRRQRERRRRLNRLAAEAPRFESLFRAGIQHSRDDMLAAGATSWADSTLAMHRLAEAFGVASMFVLQPIPDVGKPLTDLERSFLAQAREVVALRARGFVLVRDKAAALEGLGIPIEDFRDVFAEHAETIYADLVHFEDRGCAIVAQRIAACVRQRWRAGVYQSG